jgi:anionic cell wall polymer biosynthesis LytR-Cps2A-Psr (LCP) family protein
MKNYDSKVRNGKYIFMIAFFTVIGWFVLRVMIFNIAMFGFRKSSNVLEQSVGKTNYELAKDEFSPPDTIEKYIVKALDSLVKRHGAKGIDRSDKIIK